MSKPNDSGNGFKRVGTVEILKARIYPLDAESHDATRTTVVVEPGQYPLYGDGLTTFWMMRGNLNQRGVWRMGDGMFGLYESDVPTEIEVAFPSRRYGPDEWADLLADPLFVEGHADQRVRVTIDAGVKAR